MTIPLFVFSKDRLDCLKKSLASYRHIGTPISIIIHDTGTTYEPTLEYLHSLDREGIYVRWHSHPDPHVPFQAMTETVKWYCDQYHPPFYVVTDPDIELDRPRPDLLNAYSHLLESIATTCVGPWLRTDDFPDHYPFKQYMRDCENSVLRGGDGSLPYGSETIRFKYAPIDTTFAMYRGSFTWHRLNSGLRVYAPFQARHLDWYLDPSHLPEDQLYYIRTAPSIASGVYKWKQLLNIV